MITGVIVISKKASWVAFSPSPDLLQVFYGNSDLPRQVLPIQHVRVKLGLSKVGSHLDNWFVAGDQRKREREEERLMSPPPASFGWIIISTASPRPVFAEGLFLSLVLCRIDVWRTCYQGKLSSSAISGKGYLILNWNRARCHPAEMRNAQNQGNPYTNVEGGERSTLGCFCCSLGSLALW